MYWLHHVVILSADCTHIVFIHIWCEMFVNYMPSTTHYTIYVINIQVVQPSVRGGRNVVVLFTHRPTLSLYLIVNSIQLTLYLFNVVQCFISHHKMNGVSHAVNLYCGSCVMFIRLNSTSLYSTNHYNFNLTF